MFLSLSYARSAMNYPIFVSCCFGVTFFLSLTRLCAFCAVHLLDVVNTRLKIKIAYIV